MLIEVSQKILHAALQHITLAVSAKSVIPILSGIKLHVDQNGLTLTSANTGMMMQYDIFNDHENLVVHNKGSVVIPSRYFADIVRSLPTGQITIKVDDGLRICIQSGKARYNLNGMDPEEYPHIVKQKHCGRLTFSNHHLKHIMKSVTFAVSSSEVRPILTGVSFEIGEEQIRLVASDGIRLSSQTTNKFNTKEFNKPLTVIIPGKHLSDFSKVLTDEQSSTDITFGNNTISFKTNNLTLQSSLIEGTYPSINRIFPDIFTSEFIVETETLLRALERVTLLSGDSKIVNLIITLGNSINLTSNTAEIGDVIEEVQLEELHGERITVSFNGKYLLDILRAIDSKMVTLKFADKWKPLVVQPVDNPNSLFLITPIRTHEFH